MRLLYARVGRTFCRNCGREVVRETAEVVARQLGELPSGTRLLLGFDLPVVAAPASTTVEVDEMTEVPDEELGLRQAQTERAAEPQAAAIAAAIGGLRKKGFARLLINGKAVAFDDVEAPQLSDRTVLQVVVDRVQVNGEDLRQRLTDSIETAYLEGGGAAWAIEQSTVDSRQSSVTHVFSE